LRAERFREEIYLKNALRASEGAQCVGGFMS
jgi:hypothetical protein